MNLAAVILAGGTSRRMGCDKAALDFGGEPMLARVVRLLATELPLDSIYCVAAAEQAIPQIPLELQVVRDRQHDCGPLEGLATGLEAAAAHDAVFVTTCDAPLLVPQLPARLAELVRERDAAVPRITEGAGGQLYPLTAVYRPRVRHVADARLERGERRVIDFVAELDARYVSAEELRDVDPELLSLRNCNTPEEYRALVSRRR